MAANGKPENGAAAANPWIESAAQLTGVNIGFEHGGVQFIGRHRLKIHDEVIQVPFGQLAHVVANILGALDPAHPAHEALRALLATPRVAPPGGGGERPPHVM